MTRGSLGFRLVRILAYTATGVLLLWAIVQTVAIYRGADLRGEVGWDAGVYSRIGTHFIETGQPYYPDQLAGPYPAEGQRNIYPPTALYMFVPASLLPPILWWAVPFAVMAWSLWRLRPAWWTLPLMALACNLPMIPAIPVAIVYGNTLLWTVASLFAAAAFHPGLAWAVLFKPVDFLLALPFALRSWRGLVVAVALSAALLPYWFEWFTAIGNISDRASPFYSLASWPALAMPFIAWVGRGPGIRNRVTKSAAPLP